MTKLRAIALAWFVFASSPSARGSDAESVDAPGGGYPHIELGIEAGAVLWNGLDRDIENRMSIPGY